MVDGKKSLAEKIFYGALTLCEERSGQPGLNVFTQALTNIDLSPGERNFSIEVPLGEEGVAFPAGSYTIEGWVTGGAPKRYSATSGFELVHAL